MSNKLKVVSAFIGPIGFVCMGIGLMLKKDKLPFIIGVVNVVFWSCLILFSIYKLVTKKQ